MVKHCCVKFDDPSCIGFWDIVWKTDRRTFQDAAENPTHATTVGVGNKLVPAHFVGIYRPCCAVVVLWSKRVCNVSKPLISSAIGDCDDYTLYDEY